MRKRNCAILAAALLGGGAGRVSALPSMTFSYDSAAVQYSSSSTFPTGASTTTVAIVGNAVGVPLGDYFRFGVDILVTNNANPASGGLFDQQSGITEPANLGLCSFAFIFNTSNLAVLAPLSRATSPTRFPAGLYAVSSYGGINASSGQIGTGGATLGAGIAPFNFDGTADTYSDIDSFATSALAFSNVVYQSLSNGTSTVTPVIPAGSDSVVTLDPSYINPSTNTGQPTFVPNRAITTTNLPPLTINVGTGVSGLVSSAYNTSSSGNWSDASKWTNTPAATAYPNNGAGTTFTATISGAGIGVTQVSVSTSVTVNSLTLGSAQLNVGTAASLNVSGATTVTAGDFNQAGGTVTTASLQLSTGSSYQQAGGTLTTSGIQMGDPTTAIAGDVFALEAGATLNLTGSFNSFGTTLLAGSQNYSAGSTFNLLGGSATFSNDAGTHLSVNQSAGALLFTTTQHLASLTIANGSTAQITGGGNGHRSVVFTPLLSVSGTLDLTGNDLDVQQGGRAALATISDLIAQGFADESWTGNGITSSSAAADTTHLTALGVIQNNQSGTALYSSSNHFDGYTPQAGDVLVKYTYYGDANLDGKIDGSDYARIDNGFLAAGSLTGWFNGDFNYDGAVNGSDYVLVDNASNQQGATLGAAPNPTADVTSNVVIISITKVPEPGGLTIAAVAALSLLRRRTSRLLRD